MTGPRTQTQQAACLIGFVSDRIWGVLRIIKMARRDENPVGPDVLLILQDALVDAMEHLCEARDELKGTSRVSDEVIIMAANLPGGPWGRTR
jgi:hypothetical protein